MRLTSLLLFLPLTLAAPIPLFFFNPPGALFAGSNGTPGAVRPGESKNTTAAGSPTAGDQSKFKQAVKDFNDNLNTASVDLIGALSRSRQTNNTAVEAGIRTAENIRSTAIGIASVSRAIDANRTVDRNDLAIAAKNFVIAQNAVAGLEKAIVKKDAELSKLIAASAADLDAMRKTVEAILAFNNFNFDTVGEPDKQVDLFTNLRRGATLVRDGTTNTTLASVISQADKTKNDAVSTGAKVAQASFVTAQGAAQKISSAVQSDTKPNANDLTDAFKSITSARDVVVGLERAIVNEDADLSKLIVEVLDGLDSARDGIEVIRGLNNGTSDKVGEPQGDNSKDNKDSGDKSATAGDATAFQTAINSTITSLKSVSKDFAAIITQAQDTKNDVLAVNVRQLRSTVQTTLALARLIAGDLKTAPGPSAGVLTKLDKNFATAQTAASKLETAIQNKDELLSEFIASGFEDLGLARKNAEPILALLKSPVGNASGSSKVSTSAPSSTINLVPTTQTPAANSELMKGVVSE